MWYFAYGSNLLAAQMSARTGLTWSDANRPRRAQLPGYRLAFNASGNGCTYANIVRPGNGVMGVLYWCTPEALALLDKYESGYDRVQIEVLDEAGARIEAVAYIARPENLTSDESPTAEYLGRIIRGAREHGLPEVDIRTMEAAAERL